MASILKLPRRVPSSAVQFPRFQSEEGDGQRLSSRHLVELAEERPWVTSQLFGLMCDPLGVTATMSTDQITQTGWWGNYHYANILTMVGAVLPHPETIKPTMYSAAHIRHEYEWDAVSRPDTRHEVVLVESDVRGYDGREVAALLGRTSTADKQRLVISSGESTVWHEPEGPLDLVLAQSYTFYLAVLANKPSSASFHP